jgi:predicted alpha/beta hydrolase family esterase
MKAMIVPGNHDASPDEIWLPYVREELKDRGFEVIAEKMPDPYLARRKYWVAHIREKLGGEGDAIIIGHSSGGLAAMRYAEKYPVKGIVLVGVCHTDLDDPDEKKSGYFDDEWIWAKIKENTEWIIQFHGEQDSYVPVEEGRHVAENLDSNYHEIAEAGHFINGKYSEKFPELLEALEEVTN